MENLEVKPKKDHEIAQIRKQLRKRILGVVLLVIAVLSGLLFLLSLTNVQNAWFPVWLIKIWPRVIAVFVLVMIASVIILPTAIEANLNPRSLSGPGKTPEGVVGGDGHPPLGG